jgi:hypothetical protein
MESMARVPLLVSPETISSRDDFLCVCKTRLPLINLVNSINLINSFNLFNDWLAPLPRCGLFALVVALRIQMCSFLVLAEPLPNPPKDPPFNEVSPGVFQLGDVTIHKRERTITFPAVLNLSRGAMEYFLVSTWGKVHESILRTETEPYRIHAAMLLLGAKGMSTNEEDLVQVQGAFISHPSSVRLPGDKIAIGLKWKLNGKQQHKRAEELVFNTKTKSALRRGYWVYTGSVFDDQSFLAQREGSVASLITDPEALINYTGPGHDNDTIWTPNLNSLPPADTPVEVVIKLVKARAERKR